jgi:hypothetical protein
MTVLNCIPSTWKECRRQKPGKFYLAGGRAMLRSSRLLGTYGKKGAIISQWICLKGSESMQGWYVIEVGATVIWIPIMKGKQRTIKPWRPELVFVMWKSWWGGTKGVMRKKWKCWGLWQPHSAPLLNMLKIRWAFYNTCASDQTPVSVKRTQENLFLLLFTGDW